MQNFKYLKSLFTVFNIILCCNGSLKESYSTLQFGYRLYQRMIESYLNYSILDCVEECLRTTRCQSVNYYKGANFCENNFESNTTEPEMYREDSGWIYTDIKNWDKGLTGSCSEQSCSINEKCIHQSLGNSKCVLSDCGIPTNMRNTTWNVKDGDGIGIYKEMHIKCHESYEQRGSGRLLCLEKGTWKSDLVCKGDSMVNTGNR
ncbi:uncharacterized protein LOC133199102 [Saccostrea echinata]|uniref:uncharacterized protein LOC133199102 n=1 Tax=Saccostrea echinata TaxID=191078 RepID=UPI002A81EAE6|nr:uncharacterized protein LOC133199102 [Saccostrea echinata]